MSDVKRGAQIAVERLHLGEGKGVIQRRKRGRGKILRDEGEHRRRLGQDSALGHQRRHTSLGVDRQIIRATLLVRPEVYADRLIVGAGLFQRYVRGEGAGVRGEIELEHGPLGERPLQRVRKVGLLPGEAAVGLRGAAEVAVGGGAGVDRTVEAEVFADRPRRRPADQFGQQLLQLLGIDVAAAVQVDVEAERLGDADRVADLDRALGRQACGDDVLCQIAGGVGGRAVDLGGILAGERAAAVRRGRRRRCRR